MASYALDLIRDCMVAQGISAEVAARAAQCALRTGEAMGIIRHDDLVAFERDAHIYKLRGDGLKVCILAVRFGVTTRLVFKAVNRAQGRRHAALRVA